MAGIRYKDMIFSGNASFGSADDVSYDNTESGLEATDVQGALDEVNSSIGAFDFETGTLETYTWGSVKYVHDKINHICYMRFSGNNNASPSTSDITVISLPNNLQPKVSSVGMLFPLYGGGYISCESNKIQLRTNNTTWQAGSIVYMTV